MGGLLAKASFDTTALPVAEDVLWNGALLVSKSGLTALDAAVEEVDAIWPEGLQIRQIGPAPVSSFALLDVEPVSAAQITAALCLLGLRSLGDHRDLAAARRSRLIAEPGSDSQAREAIRNAAHIIDAATRAPNPGKGFTLCRMMAQGRAIASDVVTREVA